MTLPFRRRHHDDEGAHDRARALTSREMLEPLAPEEAGWLTGHLGDCAECRQDREAYLADRELLRSLRDRTPEPPRDLWARTSAALDHEARSRRSRGASAPKRRGGTGGAWRGLPFGAAAGALIVLVVVGASLVPQVRPPDATPGGSSVAVGPTAQPEPTQIEVTAGRVGWIRPSADGRWELVLASVSAVCPPSRPSCQALIEDNPARRIDLGTAPTVVTISPTNDNQLVVESAGEGDVPDRMLVVAVPPATPEPTSVPTDTPAVTPSDAPATPSDAPATPDLSSPEPSPANPEGAIEIASGVTVVGEAAYSADGHWLAFSARPSDSSTGPDLYLWAVGDATATPVTTDHRTYFSAWLDGQVLASRVTETPAPEETETPALEETETPAPAATADASGATSAPSDAPAAPVEEHPASFLLDPATLARTEIAQPDVWMPVVDPTGRFVAFWSGTLVQTANGLDWRLGTGSLVLDGWNDEPLATASAAPGAEASGDPSASSQHFPGPAGSPVEVATGEMAAFQAKFDPTGTRLAVWVGEQLDAAVGRLRLIVLDPETGAIDPEPAPLAGAPALRRFSVDVGRLAWVTPSGQDGQESVVQVLGWSRNNFGEIRTIPAKDLFLVR